MNPRDSIDTTSLISLFNIEEDLLHIDEEQCRKLVDSRKLPLTAAFFEQARKRDDENSASWTLVLDSTPSGTETRCEARVEAKEPLGVRAVALLSRNEEALAIQEASWEQVFNSFPAEKVEWARLSDADKMSAASIVYDFLIRAVKSTRKTIGNGRIEAVLDEYNIEVMEAVASRIQADWGDNQIPGTNITGNRFAERTAKMAQTARRIAEGDVPFDILEHIPLKTDGTFKCGQYGYSIPILDGKLSIAQASTEGYPTATKFMLAMTTADYDHQGAFSLGSRRAAIAIVKRDSTKKTYPLLDEEGNLQDIKTKTAYLEDENIIPGRVYKEKSGTPYLFLGTYTTDEWRASGTGTKRHYYVRWTKKLEKLADGCTTLIDFAQALDSIRPRISIREKPRKFVSETETIFPDAPRPAQEAYVAKASWEDLAEALREEGLPVPHFGQQALDDAKQNALPNRRDVPQAIQEETI